MEDLVFGPVPSRRLGKSIGVNNIPHKVCSYSCAYCQVGKGDKIQVIRQEFYKPEILVRQIEKKLNKLSQQDYPDYITIVPNGEPTLDINLGKLITSIKKLGVPVAVISNSSLLHQEKVREELSLANYVSLKVDTVNAHTWKHINKPHKNLLLKQTLDAILAFTQHYTGRCVTETMLVKDVNTSDSELSATAQFIKLFKPNIAYISIPTRPPAFEGTLPPLEETLLRAYETFSWHCLNAEFLTGYEGNAFASTGNFHNDLLSITAVHPMRIDAVKELMAKTNATEESLKKLIDKNLVKEITYERQLFIVRSFK